VNTKAVRRNTWLEVLKILSVLATIAASALGSYSVAKSDARREADASYATLKQAVEHLERTQAVIWDVVMRYPATSLKSLDAPLAGEASRPFVGLSPLPRNLEVMLSKKQERR
jgi:hypothetical protein